MKKISGLIMLPLLLATLTACGPLVVRGSESPEQTKAVLTQTSVAGQTKPAEGSASTKPAEGVTAPAKTEAAATQAAATAPAKTVPAATSPAQTMPEATVPAETTPAVTVPAKTVPAATVPVKTAPAKTVPVQTAAVTAPVKTTAGEPGKVISNLPGSLQKELDEPGTGMLVIYEPKLYKGIRQALTWDVRTYDTGTAVLVVVKEKGSKLMVLDSKMAEDGPYTVPGKMIRSWKTTSDYEVVKIQHTDPPSFVLNFIRVTEPDGSVTTTGIQSSSREVGPYLSVPYDGQ